MARPAMSVCGLGARAQSTEPAQKTPAPVSMTFLRPSSSPIIPQASMIDGERQRVGADHPLQLRDGRLQVGLQAAEPDADDGVVEERQEQQQAQRGERDRVGPVTPAAAAAARGAPLSLPSCMPTAPGRSSPRLLASVSRPQKTSSPTFHVPSCRTDAPGRAAGHRGPSAERSYFTVALVAEVSVTESTLDDTAAASGLDENALIADGELRAVLQQLYPLAVRGRGVEEGVPVGRDLGDRGRRAARVAGGSEAALDAAAADDGAAAAWSPRTDEEELELLEQADIAATSTRPSAGAR